MGNDVFITLRVEDQTSPALVKINDATMRTAEEIAALEADFKRMQEQAVAGTNRVAASLRATTTAAKELDVNAGYKSWTGFLTGVEEAKQGTKEFQAASAFMQQTLAHGAERVVPGFGRAIQHLATHISGTGLAVGALIAVGVVLITHWKAQQDALAALQAQLAKYNLETQAAVRQAALTVQASREEEAGHHVAALRTRLTATLTTIDKERDARFLAANEEEAKVTRSWSNQLGHFLGISHAISNAHALAATERDAATRQSAAKEVEARRKAADEITKLLREQATAWQNAETERLHVTQEVERQIQLARQRGLFAQAGAAAAGPSGSPRQAIGVDLAQQQAAVLQAFDAEQRRLEALLLEGKMLDSDFFAHRAALIEQTERQLDALISTATEKQTKAMADLSSSGAALAARLGPEFEELGKQFAMEDKIDKAQADFKTVALLLDADKLSARQAGDAVATLVNELLASGAKIDDIGRVVPPTLKAVTSLFRGSTVEASHFDSELGDIGTGGVSALQRMNHELIGATEYFANLRDTADGYRVTLLEIARAAALVPRGGLAGPPGAGAMTPRPGTQEPPGEDALTPRGGMTVNIDARGASPREIAEALAEGRRRGQFD